MTYAYVRLMGGADFLTSSFPFTRKQKDLGRGSRNKMVGEETVPHVP